MVSEFGTQLRRATHPRINSLSENISALVREIRSSSQTAMTLSRTTGGAQYAAIRKRRNAAASLIQTAASMDEMAASVQKQCG